MPRRHRQIGSGQFVPYGTGPDADRRQIAGLQILDRDVAGRVAIIAHG